MIMNTHRAFRLSFLGISPIAGVAMMACNANTAPETPEVGLGPDGATTVDDLVLQLDGDPVDADGDSVALGVSWMLDGAVRADLDGERRVPATLTSKGQTWEVSVTASDASATGDTRTASITVNNAAPTAELTQVPVAPDAAEDIRVDAVGSDPDEDPVTLTYGWSVDGASTDIDGPVVPSAETQRGQVWEVTVTPNDGETDGAPATAVIDIENRRPVVQSVTVTPKRAFEDTVLTASAVAFDPDEDVTTVAWTWFVNGIPLDDVDGPTLDGTAFDRGDAVVAVAVANDGFVDGEPVSSEAVEILNTAPTLDGASIDQTLVQEATDVTCSVEGYEDIDGDPEQVRIAWEVNGRLATEAPTLTGAFFDKGDAIVCAATPFDGLDEGRTVRSAPVVVQDTAPVAGGVTVTPSEPTVADALTAEATGLVDADGDDVAVTYTWRINGDVAGEGATLAAGVARGGDTIVVDVTPVADGAEGETISSAPIEVENTAPVATDVSVTPTEVFADTTLTASASATDADGDEVTLTYTWFVDGAEVEGETSASLSGAFAKGDDVYVSVTPSDDDDSGEALASSTVTVQNTVPSFDAIAIDLDTEVATEATTLTCAATGFEDLDEGDDEGFLYTWSIAGTEVGGATDATLTGDAFDRGDRVTCAATAFDGDDEGNTLTASAVTVQNSVPTASGVSLDDTSPAPGDTLTATVADLDDLDGDAVEVVYTWSLDGEKVEGETEATFTVGEVAADATLSVSATPVDSEDAEGDAVTADATVANVAPEVTAVTLSPEAVRVGDTITATAEFTDGNGDEVELSYQWFNADGAIAGATDATLADGFVGGDELYVEVTPNDGTEDGDAFTSATLDIDNTPPTIGSVTIEADTEVLTEATTLTCAAADVEDADGTVPTLTYAWSTGPTTESIDGDSFDKGDNVTCTVTANDGTDDSEPVASDAVVIENTAPELASVSIPASIAPDADVTATLGVTSDADEDEVELAYSWLVNGSEESTATTLSGELFGGGDTVELVVTPSDGEDEGVAVSSGTVTVEAGASPTIDSISLSPDSPTTLDDLTVTAEASDAEDEETPRLVFKGNVRTGIVDIGEDGVLSADNYVKGDTVEITVTATDSDGNETTDSASVVIANAVPSAPVVGFETDTVPVGDDLFCEVLTDATDPDADDGVDDLTYTFTWTYTDGDGEVDYDGTATLTDFEGDTIPGADTLGGESWTCSVTVSDGDDTTEAVTASIDIDFCEIDIEANDSVSIDYESESVVEDDGGLETVDYDSGTDTDPGTDTYAWYLYDLSTVPTDATLESASILFVGAFEAMKMDVASSADIGWESGTVAATDITVGDTVTASPLSIASTDEVVSIDVDATTWDFGAAVSDGEATLGFFTPTDLATASLEPASSEDTPLLTLTLDVCE